MIFSPSMTGSVGASTVTSNSGFLVFLDAETAAAVVHHKQLIHAQRGIGRQIEIAFHAAVVVGGERLSSKLFPLGILDFDVESLIGEFRFVVLIVLGMANPKFEMHFLPGR